MSESAAVKELLLSHQERLDREHREAYADAQYENIELSDLLGMPPVPEEEEFELIDSAEAAEA
ncbi:hypothetical protein FJ365_04510 [Candidatus Dependentiae bacterium]|nr:hypothetical protein [Candidatus Dependentiae bacterium]